jgi:hypothetical protein
LLIIRIHFEKPRLFGNGRVKFHGVHVSALAGLAGLATFAVFGVIHHGARSIACSLALSPYLVSNNGRPEQRCASSIDRRVQWSHFLGCRLIHQNSSLKSQN